MASNSLKYILRSSQLILRNLHTDLAAVTNEVCSSKAKIKKSPFMKNVFLGLVDEDILAYPEVEASEADGPSLEDNFPQLQTKALISEENPVLSYLRSGICRMGFPKEFGGIPSYSSHLLNKMEKLDIPPVTSFLLETQYSLIIETILNHGSELQKKRYLPDLMSGAITGAFALHEEEAGSDPPSIQCSAVTKDLSQDSSYILNGEKSWITNGSNAKFFIVLAQFKETNRRGVSDLLSAFIVDKETPGLVVKNQENVISEYDICQIKFNNAELPPGSMIGIVGDGYKVAVSSLESCKFLFLTSIINFIRKLLTETIVQVSPINRFLMPLRDYEVVQCTLSKIAAKLFAMESSIYFMAGIKDLYEIDISLESVIVQNLIRSYGMLAINECISIAGRRALETSYPFKKELENLPFLFRSFTSPDVNNLYISLKGLEFAGKGLAETVKKARNPLNFPGYIFKRILYTRGQALDSPKLNKKLYMQFHPSLKMSVDQLEYCICRLQYCVEIILTQHGTECVHRQLDLIRLSDIACDIFTMIAVLTRASRSYCTGIRHADQEILMANGWCQETVKRVKMNVSDIIGGRLSFSDNAFLKLAPYILQNKGYFFTSPIEKNIQ